MATSQLIELKHLQKLLKNSFKNLLHSAASLGISLGFSPRLATADRRILEQKILPYFANSPMFKRILFVGCAWYTKHYEEIFENKEYWTLEIDQAKAVYGAKKHICAEFKDINQYFEKDALDLIICNGVIGWGLNKPEEIDLAFLHAYQCLRPNGIFIIGWNDIPERRVIELSESQSLKKFQPYNFPLLGTARYRTASKNCHVYDFYIK